ncbi:hypothetical protein N7488_004785 [Penicillium malachiteum]|nr:hypothetical protein N7488_004785 [Penicillium malachiteum]
MTFQFTEHHALYPAIDASLPQLSQTGKTIFITGGAYGIGFAIAKAFAQAKAEVLILLDENANGLGDAYNRILSHVPDFKGRVVPVVCNLGDEVGLDEAWANLIEQGIQIDILVLNAAEIGAPGPLSRLPFDDIWKHFTINVRSNLVLAQRFLQQKVTDPCVTPHRTLLNVSSMAVHSLEGEEEYGAYTATKTAFMTLMQSLAHECPSNKVSVISMDPGTVYTEGVSKLCRKEDLPLWTDAAVPGSCAVWLASPPARILHGRFVCATWDVEELLRVVTGPKGFEQNPRWLTPGILGMS